MTCRMTTRQDEAPADTEDGAGLRVARLPVLGWAILLVTAVMSVTWSAHKLLWQDEIFSLQTDRVSTFGGSAMSLAGFDMSRQAAIAAYEESGLGPEDAQVVDHFDQAAELQFQQRFTDDALGNAELPGQVLLGQARTRGHFAAENEPANSLAHALPGGHLRMVNLVADSRGIFRPGFLTFTRRSSGSVHDLAAFLG